MLETCNEYAIEYNFRFSCHEDPNKSKTKCLAFPNQDLNLPTVKLGEKDLPWVTTGKHLGHILENVVNGLKKDILVKKANYISKNNEILQEFDFAHPDTKFKLNQIYNSHFTGCISWDLFSRECVMVENTWNVSIRAMYDLPSLKCCSKDLS